MFWRTSKKIVKKSMVMRENYCKSFYYVNKTGTFLFPLKSTLTIYRPRETLKHRTLDFKTFQKFYVAPPTPRARIAS